MLKRLTIEAAVDALRAGELVVFPTETSYGLGCRAMDEAAVARLVKAKHRPDGRPLPILLASCEDLRRRGLETPLYALAEAFWPGALTLVVPAFRGLPGPITAGTNMVGVRVSAHPIARALVEALGEPLVATSANQSGQPAAHDLAACDASGLNDVAGVVDGGALPGVGSTVLGLADGDLSIFRQGDLPEAEIREVWRRARKLD